MEQAKIATRYVQSKKDKQEGKQVRVGGCISLHCEQLKRFCEVKVEWFFCL
jgi:hypothetical protein